MEVEITGPIRPMFEMEKRNNENGDATDTPSEKRKWVHHLQKFGDNSSFSAAVYEFKSKSICKRLLWGLIILLAIAGFFFITAQSIILLIEEPISTSITEIRQTKLEFPAVTVCSLSFINTTVLTEFTDINQVPQYDLQKQLSTLFETASLPNTPPLAQCVSVANEIANRTGRNISFGNLVSDTARNDPGKLIVACSFQGENCINDLETIDTISGVCFTFNGPNTKTPRTVQGTGVRQGLRIQVLNGDQSFSLNNNHGYNVIVHNRDEPPRPESDGIIVGLSSSLYVGMQQIISTDKTRFYSGQDCVKNSDITSQNLAFSNYSSFSHSLCLNDCFYTHIASECQCVERTFYTPVRSPYINMRNCVAADICCEVNSFETFKENCSCPLKCERIDRTITASSATNDHDDRVGINVFYRTLVTDVLETTDSYTPWSLISDIGGNTGLFLGFTLLTVGEVVLLVLALLNECCCYSCNRERFRK